MLQHRADALVKHQFRTRAPDTWSWPFAWSHVPGAASWECLAQAISRVLELPLKHLHELSRKWPSPEDEEESAERRNAWVDAGGRFVGRRLGGEECAQCKHRDSDPDHAGHSRKSEGIRQARPGRAVHVPSLTAPPANALTVPHASTSACASGSVGAHRTHRSCRGHACSPLCALAPVRSAVGWPRQRRAQWF